MNGEVTQYIVRAAVGLLISTGGWLIMFPLRTLIKEVRAQWQGLLGQVKQVQSELTTQRTNCLTTLQSQGTEQVKHLIEISGTLQSMQLSQAELNGYIKGVLDKN